MSEYTALMGLLPSLGLACGAYVVGTASPGPATLAIIRSTLQFGRPGGISMAFGVVTGSVIWGLVSAFGLGALLAEWPDILHVLSLLGGCYLLWLSWGALRTALAGDRPEVDAAAGTKAKHQGLFFYGLGLHLTNPKAMFVWMSIIALGLPPDTDGILLPLLIVTACAVLGTLVFCSYALVFSIPVIMRGYFHAATMINLIIAALFAAASFSLLYRSGNMLIPSTRFLA